MKYLQIFSTLLLATGVACGAFGAHGLRNLIPATDLMIWEKAVLYQMLHALGAFVLLFANINVITSTTRSRIALLLLSSVIIFSGSLYLLVLTNHRWLGAITPIGGVGFIVSWIWLSVAVWRA
jgi:uncharacterized membrane protein YgdD (TMEM256/DUF423 family)